MYIYIRCAQKKILGWFQVYFQLRSGVVMQSVVIEHPLCVASSQRRKEGVPLIWRLVNLLSTQAKQKQIVCVCAFSLLLLRFALPQPESVFGTAFLSSASATACQMAFTHHTITRMKTCPGQNTPHHLHAWICMAWTFASSATSIMVARLHK